MQNQKKHRALRLTALVLCALLVLSMGALAYIGNFFYDFALNPRSGNAFGTAAGLHDDEDARWLLAESRDVYLTSLDGLQLHAYQMDPAEGHRYAILCHGYQNNATGMAAYARHFHDLGYGVLLPDARGHGGSEGDYIGMGAPERTDILGWTASLAAADPEAEIVLFGVSMGAATVMMTAGENLPDNVKCVIEDCGYTSVWDEFAGQLKELYGLPPVPILNAVSVVARLRSGYDIIGASCVEQVRKARVPMLFIHGSADTFVPFWMLDELYEAAACEKEKLVVPGAAHAESVKTAPELYWSTVDAFLNVHM